MRVTLLPERVANFFAALLRPLFWPPLVVAVVAGLVGLDIWYFGVHGIAQGLRDLIYQPLLVLFLYGLLIVSVGWHELGHATACRYGGARPGRIGFGIYIVWPAFFTDVTDAYRLPKGGRIRTDLGGIYFNAIFCLAIGAVYAATGFEPLLVLIVMQHLLIAYQFMPFLRLDGYQVMSDATGIPDLFSRVGPVLQGLIPFRTTPKKVRELKPWVRAVVTLWVLAVVPFLVYMFSMMVVSAPRILATAWDSFFAQKGAISDALAQGHDAAAATAGIQMTLLVLPVLGMGVTFSRVSRRVVGSALRVTSGRPLGRAFVYVLVAGAIGVAAFVLWPNGDYTPIQPGERWTAGDGLRAVTRPSSPEDPATGSASGTTSNSVEGSAAHDARGPVAPSTSSSGSSSFASGAAMPGEPTTSGGASGTTSRIGSAGTTPTPSATPSPSESPTASPSPSTTPEPTPSSTP
jgi:putative peptide zinc metalloprotease protein